MLDDSQATQNQTIEQQNTAVPASSLPIPSPPQPDNNVVASIPSNVYKKHGLPISFKSISIIILFFLLGSVFIVSQLSSQKGSLDLRSRASKKERSVLKNGSFEQNLLNWKEIKQDKGDSISVVSDSPTQGTKAVKLVNTSGKELTVYQDIKVDSDTWYTIRADGKTPADGGNARVELREYNLVNGSPKFLKDSLSKRFFGTSMQTRGDIVRSGKELMVSIYKNNFSLIKKAFAVYSCTTQYYSKSFQNSNAYNTYSCNDSDYENASDKSEKTYEFEDTVDPTDIQYNKWNKGRSTVRVITALCNKFFSCRGTANCSKVCISDEQDTMCKGKAKYSFQSSGQECDVTKIGKCLPDTSCSLNAEWPYCSFTNVSSPIRCGKGLDPNAGRCDKTTYDCKLVNEDGKQVYKWVKNQDDSKCLNIDPKCTSSGPNNPPTTITASPKPKCTTDDDCTKNESDTYCLSGECKKRPANCGSVCYDPNDPKYQNKTPDELDEIIKNTCSGEASECAPADANGIRHCWGSGCGGGGDQGGGGQKPAEKYIRVQLTLEKKGSAIIDNVRFTKGQDNASPKITSVSPTIATVGAQLRYQITASDENGDALTFGLGTMPCPFNNNNCKKEKVVVPKNAAISPAGFFTFTPEASGTATIQLWVSDGMKPVKQDVKLTVN